MNEDPPFEVPAVDEYSYRLLTLPNGIQALLIHDSTADKAAAAVDVRTGSLSDPDDIQGLAHFTEHMLFYSSAKYPLEDEYSKFISQHGGKTNAYTSNESTQYHFDVSWDALPDALDRFAQFFICPLISADGVSRESNAVDSEHGKNLNADPWKRLQLWRNTSNAAHPISRFSTGNLETLVKGPEERGVSVHEAVKSFYEQHYSASIMKLCVTSRHSLDELETLVLSHFTDVVDKGLSAPQFSADAVVEENVGVLLKVVPERDGHSIELQWDTLSEQQHADAAPSHYVSHLLGHEGDGSAFAVLKAKGWANGLVAGEASTSFSARSFFMVRVDLTDEGHAHVEDVVQVIFEYLQLLRAPGGINEQIYEEMRALARLKFDYRDKLDPYQYVSSCAHAMHVYDSTHLLLSMYNVPLRFAPDLIQAVVDDLTPERARVMWCSKELAAECTATEKWYGTKYSLEKLPEEWMAKWSATTTGSSKKTKTDDDDDGATLLHLPAANEFVPSDFSLLPASPSPETTTTTTTTTATTTRSTTTTPPTVVHSTDLTTLWFRPEPSFKIPKAVVYINLRCPESYVSPRAAVLTQLYSKLVNDALSELSYPADLAGLHYGLRASTQGLLISVSGYHHRLPRLAAAVLKRVLAGEISSERFDVVKEKMAKEYANMRFEQPYQVALYEVSLATEAKRWHVSDYAAVLPQLTCETLTAFVPQLFSTVGVESYVSGNLPQPAAETLVADIEADLKSKWDTSAPCAAQAHEPRVVKMPAGHSVLLPMMGPNPGNENSAVVVIFQIGLDRSLTNAMTELIAHIGKRPAFHQLRTVEQLGYLTFFSAYWTLHVRNLAFIIQSSVKSAAYLEQRVEAFLPQLRAALAGLSAEEYAVQVEELAKTKLEKPKRLREVATKDWREIDDGSLRFSRQEEEVVELRKISQEELLQFFDVHVMDVKSRRKFTVQVQSESQEEEDEKEEKKENGGEKDGGEAVASEVHHAADVEVIKDVVAWKRRQELYPGSIC